MQFLEYVIGLKMQTISVIKKQIDSLNTLNINRFRELQEIEVELLVLLDRVHKDVRKDCGRLYSQDYGVMQRLSEVCIDFNRHLAEKHSAIENLHQEIYRSEVTA